jgi:hypothetical protein
LLILLKKNHVGTRGAWAPVWGWAHPLRTRDAWAMPPCWAHPSAHVVLGLCFRCGHTLTHTWCLGSYLCAGHTPAHTWRSGTPRPNFPWAPHAAKPKIVLGHWLCRAQNRFGSCMCKTQIALGPAIVRASNFMKIKGEPAA